jgi:hypothetical protein
MSSLLKFFRVCTCLHWATKGKTNFQTRVSKPRFAHISVSSWWNWMVVRSIWTEKNQATRLNVQPHVIFSQSCAIHKISLLDTQNDFSWQSISSIIFWNTPRVGPNIYASPWNFLQYYLIWSFSSYLLIWVFDIYKVSPLVIDSC